MRSECECGHAELAHQHYRPGTDCSLCGCAQYKRRQWLPFTIRRGK